MTPEEIEEQKRQIAIAHQTLGIPQAPMPEKRTVNNNKMTLFAKSK